MIDDYENIPKKMRDAKRWMLWRSEPNTVAGKKPRKVPYYANGSKRFGDLDTVDDWNRLVTMEQAVKQLDSGLYTGLGFALGKDTGGGYWQGIDLDNLSKNKELGYIQEDLPSYTELSPSGDGWHSIGYGKKFRALGSNSSGAEAYCEKRYFTVTGECSGIGEICCIADFVEKIIKPVHSRHGSAIISDETKKVDKKTINDLKSALMFLRADDYELWIKNGIRLKELGEVGRWLWTEWSSSSKKFDMAECTEKWDTFKPSNTSYKAVFKQALDAGWHSSNFIHNDDDRAATTAQEWNSNLSSDIDYIIPFDCLARDIQQWILSCSMYPQPALAYIAAFSVIGACIGRNIAYDNIKGNMMFIGLAESGEGKDFPFKCASKLMNAVDLGIRIEGRPASGAALFDALESQPSLLLHIDEFGHFLNSVNGAGANSFSKEIVQIITEAYTSGSTEIRGKRTKGFEPKIIKEPNICVMGMTTENQVFNGLSSEDIADGSLARYMIVFGENNLMPVRVDRSRMSVPEHIIDGLNELISKHCDMGFLSSKNLDITNDYDDFKWREMEKLKKISNELSNSSNDKSMFKPFYNRILVRAVQAAMLVDECKDTAILKWFIDLEIANTKVFIKKFQHLGADNENEKMAKLLQAKIKESGKKGITAKDLLSKTRKVPTYIRKALLEEMVASETIGKKDVRVKGKQRAITMYFWIK